MTLERLRKIASLNDRYGLGKTVVIYCDQEEWEAIDKLVRSTPATESVEFKGTLKESGQLTFLLIYCGYDFHFICI